MDHNGFEGQTRHFLATIKTQLDILCDVIVQIFPLPYGLFRWFYKLKPKLVSVTN